MNTNGGITRSIQLIKYLKDSSEFGLWRDPLMLKSTLGWKKEKKAEGELVSTP